MQRQERKQKGITLVALVITIIVLLILAGVTIATLTGDNGILTRTQEAKEKTEQAQKEEQNILDSYEDKINEYAGIDWDTVLDNAQKHPDQKTSTAIGVGIDGKAVNMDLWEYTLLDDGTYALNTSETITAVEEEDWSDAQKGYQGAFTEEGKIEGCLPQYIKNESDDTFIEVTDLTYLFYNCTELKVMPEIPSTVKSMCNTFLSCENLEEISDIPYGIVDLDSTFSGCTSLKVAPNIPNTVTNMNSTFYLCSNLSSISNFPENLESLDYTFQGCSKLTKIPEIPNGVLTMEGTFRSCTSIEIGPSIPDSVISMESTFSSCTSLTTIPHISNSVEDMSKTFYNCTKLVTVPEIPESVTNMKETFSGCSSLTGIITINASLSGTIDGDDKNDYYAVLWNAATNEGCEIKLTGTCPMLENIVESTSKSNITLL